MTAPASFWASPLCKEEGFWETAWCLVVRTVALAFDMAAFNLATIFGWADARLTASVLAFSKSLRQEFVALELGAKVQMIRSKTEAFLPSTSSVSYSAEWSKAVEAYRRAFFAAFPQHGSYLQSPLALALWLLLACVLLRRVIRIPYNYLRQPEVLFFPDKTGQNLERICKEISRARHRVWLAMFTLTDDLLSDEVRSAHIRGLDVRVIVDDMQCDVKGGDAHWLANSGIPVTTDKSWALMHHKFVILDDKVLSGSFNWTKQASVANNENLCILYDRKILQAFVGEFKRLWVQFNGRGGRLKNRKRGRRCQTPPVHKHAGA
jgi:hypothetical protein